MFVFYKIIFLEHLQVNFEKNEKIRFDLEKDLEMMSEKFSKIKNENISLTSNLSKIIKKSNRIIIIDEIKNKLKSEEKKSDDLFLQNKGLSEEVTLIKEKVLFTANEKSVKARYYIFFLF